MCHPSRSCRRCARDAGELLDLRGWAERRLLGRPLGLRPVRLLRHLLRPTGPGTVHLYAEADRSTWTLRRGVAQVADCYRAWRRQGLPTDRWAEAGARGRVRAPVPGHGTKWASRR